MQHQSFESAFLSISEGLNARSAFWRNEILPDYPDSLLPYPKQWIDDLAALSREELFEFERRRDFSKLQSSSFRAYCQEMQQLGSFPKIPPRHSCSLEPRAFSRMTGKKRHEIETLSAILDTQLLRQSITHIWDFGGGIGNLARVLCNYYRLPTTTIDIDASLQCQEQRRWHTKPKAAPLQYHQADILRLPRLPELKESLSCDSDSAQSMSIGLHTCGALANAQLRLSAEAQLPVILNFSCCYNKMSEADYYLSDHGKRNPLILGNVARTLATFSARQGITAYEKWKRVKTYRYLIHLFLYHELGIKDATSLGTSNAALYRGDFSSYGVEQLQRLGIPNSASLRTDLSTFAKDHYWLQQVQTMILANSIRNLCARALEALLVVDRALFLTDHDYCVEVQQHFDPRLSPRNLGILAYRPH